jgi:hypothetical protein
MSETKLNGCIVEQCKILTECNLAYGCENPPCAGAVVENCHSTQQLKAEIAALANEVEAGIIISECYIKNIINRLRQLSAV